MRVGQALWLVGPSSPQTLWPSPGTLKAKDFKKRCLQATITQDSTYGKEDCLYLNIWVPQGKKEGLLSPHTLQLPSPCRKPPSSQRPCPCPWVVSGGFRAALP